MRMEYAQEISMGDKKPVNLSLDAELLARAKALEINLSQALEPKLREIVRVAEAEAWRAENASAIRSFNEHVEKNGVFGGEWRKF
jgi:antitoxin CcdA